MMQFEMIVMYLGILGMVGLFGSLLISTMEKKLRI